MEGTMITFGTVAEVLDVAMLGLEGAPTNGREMEVKDGVGDLVQVTEPEEGESVVLWGDIMEGELAPARPGQPQGSWAPNADVAARKRVMQAPAERPQGSWASNTDVVAHKRVTQAPAEKPQGSWASNAEVAARKRVIQAPAAKEENHEPRSMVTKRCSTRIAIAAPSPPPPPSIEKYGTNGALITWASSERDNGSPVITAAKMHKPAEAPYKKRRNLTNALKTPSSPPIPAPAPQTAAVELGLIQRLLEKVRQIQLQQIQFPQTWRWISVAGVCVAIVAASVVLVH